MTAADVQHRHEWLRFLCLAASTNSLPISYLLLLCRLLALHTDAGSPDATEKQLSSLDSLKYLRGIFCTQVWSQKELL